MNLNVRGMNADQVVEAVAAALDAAISQRVINTVATLMRKGYARHEAQGLVISEVEDWREQTLANLRLWLSEQ